MPFQQQIKAFAPPWFLRRWMGTFLEAVGKQLDQQAQRAFDGRRSAIPYAGTGPNAAVAANGQLLQCEIDVIPYHARDRDMLLFDEEGEASQRYRLSRFRQLHKRRGSHLGEMEHAQPFFLGPGGAMVDPSNVPYLPTMLIAHTSGISADFPVQVTTWHKMSPSGVFTMKRADPGNFIWDDQADHDSRFWLFLLPPAQRAAPITYDGGATWDDGSVYDGAGFSAQAYRDLVNMIRGWDAAHSQLFGYFVVWGAPSLVDPAGTPTQDADGWWSLPNQKWQYLADPGDGRATRPPYMETVYDVGLGIVP